MKHVKHGKKLISLLLSAAVAMSMTLSTVMTPLAASSSVSDLRQRLQELQTEQEKVNQQLKDAQSNKADAEALKTQLEQQKALILSQISNLSEQIGSLDEEIVNKQDEIDRKQQEIDQKQAEYDQRWADFKDRMRAMQRLNDGGSIALLSSATNLYQLLTFATTLDQIVNKDEDTCQQLENEHAELEQQRAELEQAKAAVLDRIVVDYYGTPTPIQQIAAISTPDPRILQISPWDGSALKSIEKAILNSDLGINPQNDGKSIRLAFPQLTEERRKDLVKQIRKYNEGGKVAIRNIRRDAMESFKKKEKASEITEDDLKQAEKDLQKLTDDSSKKIDELLARKEKELMEI